MEECEVKQCSGLCTHEESQGYRASGEMDFPLSLKQKGKKILCVQKMVSMRNSGDDWTTL